MGNANPSRMCTDSDISGMASDILVPEEEEYDGPEMLQASKSRDSKSSDSEDDILAMQRRFEAMVESEFSYMRARVGDSITKMFEEAAQRLYQLEQRNLLLEQELETARLSVTSGISRQTSGILRQPSELLDSQRLASIRARLSMELQTTEGRYSEVSIARESVQSIFGEKGEAPPGPPSGLVLQVRDLESAGKQSRVKKKGRYSEESDTTFEPSEAPTTASVLSPPISFEHVPSDRSTQAAAPAREAPRSHGERKISFAERMKTARNYWPIPPLQPIELDVEESSRQHPRSSRHSIIARLSGIRTSSVIRSSVASEHSANHFQEKVLRHQPRTGDFNFNQKGFLQRFMMMPSSKRTLSFDVLGIVFIGYDVLMIPFSQAFNPKPGPYLKAVGLISVVFWTLDIARTFLLGYHINGLIEMRPSRVAKHYLRTWLLPDVFIVMIDWVFLFMLNIGSNNGEEEPQGLLRITRSARALRALRILRLLRLAKVRRIVKKLSADIHGEYVRMTLEISYIITLLLIICHYVACFWFWLSDAPGKSPNNWVRNSNLEDSSMAHKYLTSLHWALTQFTPATIEIHPMNEHERLFATFTVLFGLLTFSTILSNITSKMSILRGKFHQHQQDEDLLWRYFSENKVSIELGRCILDIHSAKMREQSRRLHEKDIAILEDLPYHLGKQLHLEVYDSLVSSHPLLWRWRHIDTSSFAQICHGLMSEHELLSKQDLFMKGDCCTRMYFIITGNLSYIRGQVILPVQKGDWISEAALWLPLWEHRGRLAANSVCDIVGMNSGASRIMVQSSSMKAADFVRVYAAHFLRDELEIDETLSEKDKSTMQYSDVWGGHNSINALAAKAAIQTFGRDSWTSNKGKISALSLSSLSCEKHEGFPKHALPTVVEEEMESQNQSSSNPSLRSHPSSGT